MRSFAVTARVNGLFQLTNDVHEYAHVRRSFRDGFGQSFFVVPSKVSVTTPTLKVCLLPIECSIDPFVGVVKVSVIIEKLLKVGKVWALSAGAHDLVGRDAKALQEPAIKVLLANIVSVLVFGCLRDVKDTRKEEINGAVGSKA
jgi:hypothetical protein